MKRFMLVTYGAEQPTPESQAAWGAWGESIAARIVGHGGFAGAGREVSHAGAKDLPSGKDSMTGYCILEAESLAEAEAIAGRAPFVTAVRVYALA